MQIYKIIDSQPGMNVTAVNQYAAEGFPVVEFTPSPHGGLERLWFYFGMENIEVNEYPVTRLILKNINTMLGSNKGNFLPVYRYSGGSWQRLPEARKLLRDDGYISLYWDVESPESLLEIAFCYPYGEKELNALLKDTGNYWQQNEIGVSAAGRPYYRLSNNFGSATERPFGFYLIARQHAMETSGAWVLDGILRHLAELDAAIPVWVIPFANLDGIIEGDYGKDPFPRDINRAWGPNAMMRHETKTISCDLDEWRQRVGKHSIICDLHSPGADEENLYVFMSKDIQQEEPLYQYLRELNLALQDYAADPFIKHSDYKPYSAWGKYWNLSEYANQTLEMPVFSMEISYYKAGGRVLEIDGYRNIGKIIADWACSLS